MNKVLVVYAVPVLFENLDEDDSAFSTQDSIKFGSSIENVLTGDIVQELKGVQVEFRGVSVIGKREVTDEEIQLGSIEAAVYNVSLRGI